MVTYENECVGCATENYPCLGSSCPNRNVEHLYCDICGQEQEELYLFEEYELCLDCLLKQVEKITL